MSFLSHSWDMSLQDARRLQVKLAAHIIRENRLKTVNTVAGIDVGMRGDMACAAMSHSWTMEKPSAPLYDREPTLNRCLYPLDTGWI